MVKLSCPFCGADWFNVRRGFGTGRLGCLACGKDWEVRCLVCGDLANFLNRDNYPFCSFGCEKECYDKMGVSIP